MKDRSDDPSRHERTFTTELHLAPQTLMSDNGSNFINEDFKKFGSDWGFQHKSSHYPILYGLSERYVRIVKSLREREPAQLKHIHI